MYRTRLKQTQRASRGQGREQGLKQRSLIKSPYSKKAEEKREQEKGGESLRLPFSGHRSIAEAAAEASADGYARLALQGSASAVVTASNEAATLPKVLFELGKLPLREIIVVLNGCTDGSFETVQRDPRVIRLSFPMRLGHDVGRAIGAAVATGDIILFMDGDLPLPAEELAPFLLAVDRGADVALNDISPFLPPFSRQDDVTRSKSYLNLSLGRPDLKANSMTAVPHAISRRALAATGTSALVVPPKAQAIAMVHGLNVCAPHSVNVLRGNRIRSGNTGAGNPVARLIIGDHIEALGEAMKIMGARLGTTRLSRSELAKARNVP
ncbi:glycosyl transferase family 2 [Fontibacillus phaseoli]|uniref:Glycosyl transferase family 2 n=1 Tax=Fontibacillus phaseoli TaxID=1416533 RepID=A0A369BDY7_9BACL|nr:glycosyltransferase [Fontibacillus phaseoli]RCX19763.1 glycosyl transferase family 2 [Fontibacillus phaseoli]